MCEYIKCLVEWEDDKLQQEVIIKTTNDIIDQEDDYIFFYGLSHTQILECIKNGTLCENEWKILKILEVQNEIFN